jgi:hypothetical protein
VSDRRPLSRRECPYDYPPGGRSAWSSAQRLHSDAASLAEPFEQRAGYSVATEAIGESEFNLRRVGDAADVAQLVQEVLAEVVRDARRSGASWEQIGFQLGISRQAAQQRWSGAK